MCCGPASTGAVLQRCWLKLKGVKVKVVKAAGAAASGTVRMRCLNEYAGANHRLTALHVKQPDADMNRATKVRAAYVEADIRNLTSCVERHCTLRVEIR